MNTAEYERMYNLENEYWWFLGRHRLIEALMCRYYGTGDKPTERKILDVGCGTGAMSTRLQKWGNVVSMDFSTLALQFSQHRGVKYLVGADAMRLPFASCGFDTIVSMDVLEHIPDDKLALSEFYRVLRPGGRVLLSVPAYPHLWSEHDVALQHFRRYLRPELEARFQEAGFHIEKLSHTMTLLYPIVALQRRLNARKPTHDPPQAAMPIFPAPINATLTAMLYAENALARNMNFPFGVTLLCIATKP